MNTLTKKQLKAFEKELEVYDQEENFLNQTMIDLRCIFHKELQAYKDRAAIWKLTGQCTHNFSQEFKDSCFIEVERLSQIVDRKV